MTWDTFIRCIHELFVSISAHDLGEGGYSEGRTEVNRSSPLPSEVSGGDASTCDRPSTNVSDDVVLLVAWLFCWRAYQLNLCNPQRCATPTSLSMPSEVITSMDGLQVRRTFWAAVITFSAEVSTCWIFFLTWDTHTCPGGMVTLYCGNECWRSKRNLRWEEVPRNYARHMSLLPWTYDNNTCI